MSIIVGRQYNFFAYYIKDSPSFQCAHKGEGNVILFKWVTLLTLHMCNVYTKKSEIST